MFIPVTNKTLPRLQPFILQTFTLKTHKKHTPPKPRRDFFGRNHSVLDNPYWWCPRWPPTRNSYYGQRFTGPERSTDTPGSHRRHHAARETVAGVIVLLDSTGTACAGLRPYTFVLLPIRITTSKGNAWAPKGVTERPVVRTISLAAPSFQDQGFRMAGSTRLSSARPYIIFGLPPPLANLLPQMFKCWTIPINNTCR